jgi:peptidoglycan/LPS O-acetylase OafA/YrhL
MVTTRGVLALLVIGLMVAALVAGRREEEAIATWLMAAGFAVASAWAGLGVVFTRQRGAEGLLGPQIYLSLLAMAVAFAVYFGLRAKEDDGLSGRW